MPEVQDAGWQPIATAPKDGSYVLIWFDTGHSRGHAIAHWEGREWENSDSHTYAPMHWMPLPAGPKP